MCSFFITNLNMTNNSLEKINYFLKFRGPDKLNLYKFDNYIFLHNLLHITGEQTLQPFIDDENDIIALYNGEIYNYSLFGNYKSDGECLIPLYKKYSFEFIKYLHGEFAIVLFDFKKDIFIISTDIFSTKPLFYSINNNDICISSYKSGIEKICKTNIIQLIPNTTMLFKISTLENFKIMRVFEFDFYQYKNTYDDWCDAFINSVKYRINNVNDCIICLSSGYDSGCISSCLNLLSKKYTSFSVINNECINIINDRININKVKYEILELKEQEKNNIAKYLNKYCEPYKFNYKHNYHILRDSASIGLAKIFSIAKNNYNLKIALSGQGADEIISNYEINTNFFPNSFTKEFITNNPLDNVVWNNFFNDKMRIYLDKEEYIGGTYGIESRYPFLDKYVVQEFLYLSQELKNNTYKGCIKYFLDKHNYPYELNKKRGFVL